MGNIGVIIKRFLGNKNTVTIIAVLVGVVVIYTGYNLRVREAITPEKVPYAKTTLIGNTKITKENVGVIEVSKNLVAKTPELVKTSGKVIGRYVSYDSKIAEGSLFYQSQLSDEPQSPSYITEKIDEGYTLFSLTVDMHTTYANSIMPGDYIDLFISATNDERKIIVAKLIESIEVRDVRDNEGKSVFSSMSKTKTPTELIFAVPNEIFLLLTRATKIGSIKLFPVPRNKEYTETSGQRNNLVASASLQEFINSKSDLTYNE